jgi:choline-phosphate cytidylyltransferase
MMTRYIFVVSSLKEFANIRILYEKFTSSEKEFHLAINENEASQVVKTIKENATPTVFIIAQLNNVTKAVINCFPASKVFYVDHGVSFLKFFIIEQCKQNNIVFLLSGNILPRLYQIGNKNVKAFESYYPASNLLFSPPVENKREFCLRHNLDPNRKIILFCPTWIAVELQSEPNHPFWNDYNEMIRLLSKENSIIITHPDGMINKLANVNFWRNDGILTFEAMKHSDILISDTSSVMFEFAALGKPVIQTVLTRYADNLALNYKLPLIPIINKPFSFGLLTTPRHVDGAIKIVLETPELVQSMIKEQKRLSVECGIVPDSTKLSVEKIQSISEQENIENVELKGNLCQDILRLPFAPFSTKERIVITFGTFDVTHTGHFNIFTRAKNMGTKLIVGVSSDELNMKKKNRLPIMNQDERIKAVQAFPGVDHVFVEEALELKRHYLLYYQADVFVMGDDWKGRMDEFRDICEVCYLTRTPGISTTDIIARIKSRTDL